MAEEEIPAIDNGLNRSDADGLNPPGAEDGRFANVSDRDTKIAKAFLFGGVAASRLTTRELLGEAVLEMRPALLFVYNDCFQGKNERGLTAQVLGVFARAYYTTEFREKLIYAGTYLLDGGDSVEKQIVQRLDGTSSLKHLYKYLLESTKGHGSAALQIVYRRTQRMLSAFLHGQDLNRLSSTDEELFTVPERFDDFKTISNTENLSMMLLLQSVAEEHGDGELLTPKDVAALLLKYGFKTSSNKPDKLAAAAFAREVKKAKGTLAVAGVGEYQIESGEEDPKRINLYRFRKHS